MARKTVLQVLNITTYLVKEVASSSGNHSAARDGLPVCMNLEMLCKHYFDTMHIRVKRLNRTMFAVATHIDGCRGGVCMYQTALSAEDVAAGKRYGIWFKY